jgi:integrase
MPTYQDKSGRTPRWRYRFTYRGAKYSGTTPLLSNTKATAARMEREHHDKLQAGGSVERPPLLRVFASRFVAHQNARIKPTSMRRLRIALSKHILPRLGHKHLDEINVAAFDAFAADLRAAGLAPQTTNGYLATLRSMLALASKWGVLAKVPEFNYLKTIRPEIEFLSEDDADRLLAAAPEQWRTMILVALRTGLRAGELRGLKREDVDLERAIIHVRRTDPGRRDTKATAPKSNKTRKVPLTPDTIKALRLWLARPRWTRSGDILFPSRRGGVPCGKSCEENLGWIADAAGVKVTGWHTLRHTYASWLVMRGVPLRVVQQYLGHASIVMTERYAHLAPDYGHAAVALLDVRIGKATLQDGLNALPPGDPERKE